MSQITYPPDVRICNACGQWTAVTDFRKRSDGRLASDCRDCHNEARARQQRQARACRRGQQLTAAFRQVNRARDDAELRGAANAILGLSRGYRGFAKLFATEFNQAKPGSQMRCSMLLAAAKLLEADARSKDRELQALQQLSDAELEAVIAQSSPARR